MSKSNTTGRFVVLDGPNGVGKTTITAPVAERLRKSGLTVFQTKEPTSRFRRDNEEQHRGVELAQLIVEDRRQHLMLDIEPALARGEWVISDRYVCSSLVFRALDGVSFEETWAANNAFLVPDVSIVLTASAGTLEKRLSERSTRTRFEREHSSQKEINLYEQATDFLREKGYAMHVVLNDHCTAEETIATITGLVSKW